MFPGPKPPDIRISRGVSAVRTRPAARDNPRSTARTLGLVDKESPDAQVLLEPGPGPDRRGPARGGPAASPLLQRPRRPAVPVRPADRRHARPAPARHRRARPG